MSFWNRLKNLDKTFSWSFFGFLLGAIGLPLGGFGVWAYFNSPSPKLTYEVLTNTPVFDIREENVDKLQVVYDGVDITNSQLTLQVINFRVINNGRVDITKSMYDPENAPLGLRISVGEIVQAPVIIAASDDEYLKDNLKVEIVKQNEIQFNPVILNSRDYFTVKLLALVPNGTVDLQPIGKIAGISKIKLNESYQESVKIEPLKDEKNASDTTLNPIVFVACVSLALGITSSLIEKNRNSKT
ncbi:MAG: hypothetical protein F6J86_29630 [Symploca sp. SIO1B1]|nr:hypothetical protein [Symploca sp. SIO1B1]